MAPLLVSLLLPGLERAALRLALALAVAAALAYGSVLSSLSGPASFLGGATSGPQTGGGAPARQGASSAWTIGTAAAGPDSGGAPATRAASAAQSLVGRPYVWGGTDPGTGVDCSGLVLWSYRQAGVALPRTAQQQYDATRRLAPDELRPGDLLFFSICCQPPDTVTHVGVYLGAGRMVHAPAPGESVRIESVSTPYWRSHWAGAGRAAAPSPPSPIGRERAP